MCSFDSDVLLNVLSVRFIPIFICTHNLIFLQDCKVSHCKTHHNLLMDIWVISSLGLLQIMLLQTFLLGVCLRLKFLWHEICVCSGLVAISSSFLKQLYQFTYPQHCGRVSYPTTIGIICSLWVCLFFLFLFVCFILVILIGR